VDSPALLDVLVHRSPNSIILRTWQLIGCQYPYATCCPGRISLRSCLSLSEFQLRLDPIFLKIFILIVFHSLTRSDSFRLRRNACGLVILVFFLLSGISSFLPCRDRPDLTAVHIPRSIEFSSETNRMWSCHLGVLSVVTYVFIFALP
jgi:hypothetical protein